MHPKNLLAHVIKIDLKLCTSAKAKETTKTDFQFPHHGTEFSPSKLSK